MSRPTYKVSNTAQDEAVNFNRLATYTDDAVSEAFENAHDAIILKSTTEGSTKTFSITVDDDGELTATEITEGD